MSNRRTFIRQLTGAGILAGSGLLSWDALAGPEKKRLTILHTNDMHSRIDPFPMNDPKHPGMGGFARRAALINTIRAEEKNVLLFDSGDIFQGTPYFNLFNGVPEIQLMNAMNYAAATLGNHDFDGGIDQLAQRIQEAKFPFLCANYDFTHSPLESLTSSFQIFEIDGLRIGVFGLGIDPKGLIDNSVSKYFRYTDPLVRAKTISRILSMDEKCDMVICLSHLGYQYKEDKISDVILARQTEHIDLILGGHTHTFLDNPVSILNAARRNTLVAQAGWAGLRLGRIDFEFDHSVTKKYSHSFHEKNFNYTIGP